VSLLPIRVLGDPILREETKPVGTITPEIQQLIDDMFETMYAARGIGLAAPQVGRSERLAVVDVDDEESRELLAGGEELWPTCESHDPHTTLGRREMRSRLRRAFATLPEIHQRVLVLREVEGLSYEEIAATLRIKKGTVMSRLFHARKTMQQQLTKMDRAEAERVSFSFALAGRVTTRPAVAFN
jgi:RNA polymerase sigma factor (sigma-70 family)